MRRAVFTLCLALAVTIAVSAGIRAKATPGGAITIVHTYLPTGSPFPGTFESSGAVVDSGPSTMVVRSSGKAFHCVSTNEGTAGTFVVDFQCNSITGNGEWRVVSGTGAYSDLKANGSLYMDFSTLPAYFTENFTGEVH